MNVKHGGNVHEFAKLNNIEANDVIDFSSNVNFVKPSFLKSFEESALYSYPDIGYGELIQTIRKKLGLDETIDCEVFNGASSGIFSLFRHINPAKCDLYAPLYLEYKRLAHLYNCETNVINRFTNMDASVSNNSLVIFVNPSTPDGTLYKLDDYLEFWRAKNCTVLIDESFMDFTDQTSIIPLIGSYDNLYVLRSFTKTYGSAGIRIGSVIGSKSNISELRRYEPPWKISTFDSCYLINAINDELFLDESKKLNEANKKILRDALIQSPLVEKVHDSSANFFLVKLRYHTAEMLQELLTPYNILIRNCYNFDYLGNSYIRLSVKDIDAINTLINSLEEIKHIVM